MFSFAYPWLLFLFLLFPFIGLYLLKWKKNPAILMPSTKIFKKVATKRNVDWSVFCYLVALTIFIFALARPREGNERLLVRAQGIDIELVLDLSGSMEAFDIPNNRNINAFANDINKNKAYNRLDEAKIALTKFVEERPNDRIGLIGFGDHAYSFVPMTLDHGRLLEHLKYLKPSIIGEQTAITPALAAGIKRLSASKAPRRVLVFFTDGVNNVESRLTPIQVAELAKTKDVIIYTVGIGSVNSLVKTNFGLQQYQQHFDVKLLKEIAKISDGKYFHASDGEELLKVMQQINKLEKTNIEAPKTIAYKEFAPYLSIFVLIFILIGFITERCIKIRLP